jgi:hypothetical protein
MFTTVQPRRPAWSSAASSRPTFDSRRGALQPVPGGELVPQAERHLRVQGAFCVIRSLMRPNGPRRRKRRTMPRLGVANASALEML